ncbi:hypothetical protein ISCGN_030789 [Ixodes scapularis]
MGTSSVEDGFFVGAPTSVSELPERYRASSCFFVQCSLSKLEKSLTESAFHCASDRIFGASSATARLTEPTPVSPPIQKSGKAPVNPIQGDIKQNSYSGSPCKLNSKQGVHRLSASEKMCFPRSVVLDHTDVGSVFQEPQRPLNRHCKDAGSTR